MAEQSARAYLLWGEDGVSRDEIVRSFRSRMLARPGGPLNLIEFHAPEIDAASVIAACDTLPFLDDRRLVILHHLFSWRPRPAAGRRDDDSRDGASQLKEQRRAVLEYLPRLAPMTTLILNEGELGAAQRSEVVQQLPPERADVRAFGAPRGAELERWLVRRARARRGDLEPRAAGLLAEHGPASLEALDQEVAKLVTYAGGEPVDVDAVEELMPGAEIVVFELLDALAEGRVAQALASLSRLYRQGQRPEELTPQVISLYRRLLVCRLALDERRSPADVQRSHGVKIYDKLRGQARGFSAQRLELALERLAAFDRQLKRSEVEPENGLMLLVEQLAGLARG